MLAEDTLLTIDSFVLKSVAVVCGECGITFSTVHLAQFPPVTEYDLVEADLHRVFPDPALRAALITVCPECGFANWTVRMQRSSFNPDILPEQPVIEHSKKFAMAVKSARSKNQAPLDIAFIAMNGLYCARESGEDPSLWLELAAYEQNRGLSDETLLIPATGLDFLTMAELWRQLQHFEQAIACYEKAAADEDVPMDIVNHQKKLASMGNSEPTQLPPYLVRKMFPEAELATSAVKMGKNGRPIPRNIVRKESTLLVETESNGPPDRRPKLSSAVSDTVSLPVFSGSPAAANADERAPLPAAVESNGAAASVADAFEPKELGSLVETSKASLPQPSAVNIKVSTPAEIAEAGSSVAASTPAEQTAVPEEKKAEPKTVKDLMKSDADEQAQFTRVRQIIAMPEAASSISLVTASQVNVPGSSALVDSSKGKKNDRRNASVETEVPAAKDESVEVAQSAGTTSSRKKTGAAGESKASQRVLRRAMKAQRNSDPDDMFPEIQITDEDLLDSDVASEEFIPEPMHESEVADLELHGNRAEAKAAAPVKRVSPQTHLPAVQYHNDEDDQAQSAAGAAATETDGDGTKDHADAIARVEGFLSLTRLPSYQSWIKGYRK